MTGPRSTLDFALATAVLLCCLAVCAQSLSVRKPSYSRPADDGTYQEGKILFGDLYGQNGGGPSGTSAPPLDPRVQQQWQSMKPSCQCARNHMYLQAREPGASALAWGGGVPQSCGYRVTQDSAHGLQLSVPYDGCRVVALDGRYLLPMLWQGIPITLVCSTTQTSSSIEHQRWPQSYGGQKGQQQVVPPPQNWQQHQWNPTPLPPYQFENWQQVVHPPQTPTAAPTTVAQQPGKAEDVPQAALNHPWQWNPYWQQVVNPQEPTAAPTTAAQQPGKGKDVPQTPPPPAQSNSFQNWQQHQWNPALPPHYLFENWQQVVHPPQTPTAAPTTAAQQPGKGEDVPQAALNHPWQWNPYWQQVVNPQEPTAAPTTAAQQPGKGKDVPQTPPPPAQSNSFQNWQQHQWNPALPPPYQFEKWQQVVHPPQTPTAAPTTAAQQPGKGEDVPQAALNHPWQWNPHWQQVVNPQEPTAAPTTAAQQPGKGKDVPQTPPPPAQSNRFQNWQQPPWNPALRPPPYQFQNWQQVVHHPQTWTVAQQPGKAEDVPQTTPAAPTAQAALNHPWQWNPYWQQVVNHPPTPTAAQHNGFPGWRRHQWNPALKPHKLQNWQQVVHPPQIPTAAPTTAAPPPTTAAPPTAPAPQP